MDPKTAGWPPVIGAMTVPAPFARARPVAPARPTVEQTQSSAFKVIVGHPKYTRGGLLKGTTLDATEAGLLEIKHGSSVLDSSYQLRLQTFRSLTEGTPYTIRTTRPINPSFRDWLQRWGVKIEGF